MAAIGVYLTVDVRITTDYKIGNLEENKGIKMKKSSSLDKQLFLSDILLTESILDEYASLQTDEKRFKLALELVVQYSDKLFEAQCKQKITERAIRSRQDGNKDFVISQYWEAIKQYTESIIYAEDSSEEQALSFGNRSAACFEIRKYADCVKDIDRALNLKYPDQLKTKLYKRKGICLGYLGRPDVISSFQEAIVWLDKMTVSKDEMNKLKTELEELIANPPGIFKYPVGRMPYPVPKIITPNPEMLTPNPEIPSASDAVAIEYSETLGRHLVATRAIKPGEILIVEKPYCPKLNPDKIYTHCSHCLRVSYAMIPCKFCANVAYCSEECKGSAWDEYHEMECPIIGLLAYFGLNEAFAISTRVTIKATEKGKKLRALRKELKDVDRKTDERTKAYGNDGKFHTDQYRSIYTLRTKTDVCFMQKRLGGALWSALTVYLLARETEIFGKKLSPATLTKNSDVIFYGGLMLRNVHIVMMKTQILGSSDPASAKRRGHVLTALSSVANHSCDSNTCMQCYEEYSVLYATYPIKKGEQITNSFGPRFFTMEHTKRKQYLTNQNIECNCEPCTKVWPAPENSPSFKKQPLTRKDKKKISDYLQRYFITYRELDQADILVHITEMQNETAKLIEFLYNVVKKPCAELNMAVVMLKDLCAAVESKYDHSPVYPLEVDIQCVVFTLWLKNLLSQE